MPDVRARQDSPVHLVLRGEPTIQVGSAQPHRLERREAAMFALLILEGPQARPVLAELVWPDAEPRKALSSLRQRLYRLRRTTGHVLLTDDGPLNLAGGVTHDLHPDWVAAGQASEFELLGAHHYPPGEPLAERVHRLREIWSLRRAECLIRAADAFEAAQAYEEAASVAERLLLLQPASETAHRRCIRLHYLRGDRGQALASYTRCRTRLQQLVGVGPDEETRALAAMIESSTMGSPHSASANWQVALALPPRLVGRETALARMRTAWERRQVIVLQGEAGIGKSRLALEFGRARGSLGVVVAHHDERNTPYAWLARWLRGVGRPAGLLEPWVMPELARLVPEWGEAASGALEVPRLRQAVAALVRADRRHDAWLFDDMHWMDAASLELVLNRPDERGGSEPRLLMCVRDTSMPPRMAAWLGAHAAHVELVPLGPLTDDGVRELLTSLRLPGLADEQLPAASAALVRLTSGHPMVLLEWLRAGHAPWQVGAPPSQSSDAQANLNELLTARLTLLPQPRQHLLQLAAMAGAAASWPLVAAAAGRTDIEDAGDRLALIDARLIQADGAPPETVREAILALLTSEQRQALASALAPALAARGAVPELQASLWATSGRWIEAAECWKRAAISARRLSRRCEELALWDQAAQGFDQAEQPDRAWLAREAAAAAALLIEDARQLVRRLDRLLADARTPRQQLAAHLAQARARLNAHQGAAALESARCAWGLARDLGEEDGEFAATTWHALALAMTGKVDEGLSELATCERRAQARPDDRLRLDYNGAVGHVLHMAGRFADAMVALTEAATLAERLQDLGEALEQWTNVATCANSLGHTDDAIRHGERALHLWRRLDQPLSVTSAAGQSQLAASLMGVGRFDEAQTLLHAALACFVASGPASWRAITEHRLATLYLRLGQPARARHVLTHLPNEASAGLRMMRRLIECRVEHGTGRVITSRLRTLVQDMLVDAHEPLQPMDRHALLLALAAHVPDQEASELARRVLQECDASQPLASGGAEGPAAVHARARLAMALAGQHQLDDARQEARRAWSHAAHTGALDIDRASLCRLIQRAASKAGDTETVEAADRAADSWIRRALAQMPASFRPAFLRQHGMPPEDPPVGVATTR